MSKILVVGVGSIGRRHIDNFKDYFNQIDIVDTRQDRIEQSIKQFKINKSFSDYKIAIKNESYDAVIITTPPHLHLEIAKKAVEFNNNIFIEKPLGVSAIGWEEIAIECKKKQLINYVAYCHRHIPYTNKLIEFLDPEQIGRVVNVIIRWGSYLPNWHPWEDYRTFYMAKKEQGGGALLDESHGLDLVRYLFGEIEEVFAIVDKISDLEITSDDSAFLTLRTKKNALIQISFDLNSRDTSVSMEIIGTLGNLIWDRDKHFVKFFDIKENKWNIFKYKKEDFLSMYPNQAKHFYECITNKTKTLIDIDDAIKTQKIIDLAFESNKQRKLLKL